MTSFHTMKSIPTALLLILAAIVAGCSGDPAPKHVVHYFHPQLTADNAFLYAGYEDFTEGATAAGSAPNLVYRALPGTAETKVFLPGFSPRERFWVEPSKSLIVTFTNTDAVPGFRFFDRSGTLQGTLTDDRFNIKPYALAFNPFGGPVGSFLLAGAANGRVQIVHASYSAAPWQPDAHQVVLDTVFDAVVHDVCWTSNVTYAIYLSNGNVREYNMVAGLLHSWQLNPRVFEDRWQTRLRYKESLGERRLFAIDDSGIVLLDLKKHGKAVITSGIVKEFDVNPSDISDLMAYETRSGDVWTAYIDGPPPGYPRGRLRQQHAPFFSKDGIYLATVSRIDAWTDTLAVRKSPFL